MGGDFSGGAGLAGGVLALVLQEGEDLAGLVGLALGLIELGELELGEVGGNGAGLAFAELVVDVDGLGVLAGLLVEVGEGILAKSSETAIPAGGYAERGRVGPGRCR